MDEVQISSQLREKWEIELPQLLLKGYESQARHWLELIQERSKEEDIESLIPLMYECLDKAEIVLVDSWLEENGSSVDDIESIKMKGYKSRAEKMLEKARDRVKEGKVCFEVNQVWEYLVKARLKPEDIKTSECELKQLLKDGDALEFRKK